jgi:hypothetical protein
MKARIFVSLLAALAAGLGMTAGTTAPAVATPPAARMTAATDGDMYGCGGPYYCLWIYTPHVGISPTQRWYVPSMANCQWYYVSDFIVQNRAARSQGNGSAYWLEAFNGYDGGRAIIYGWATGRYPAAMSTYWQRLSAVRKIPAGQTSCPG